MAMNTGMVQGNVYNSYSAQKSAETGNTSQTEKTERTRETESTRRTGSYGRTIGEPKLSEAGSKYYDQLKKQFGNMDFVLVSKDQKEFAKANLGRFTNPNKTTVFIDEEKIEKMATDEEYRKKYEGIIKDASTGISKLKEQLEQSGQGNNIAGFGMKVDDNGVTSFFAVMKKSTSDQKARIEKRAEAKKAEKKAEDKKADKKAREEKLKEARAEKADSSKVKKPDEETVTLKADSIEELMNKISDYNFAYRSDTIQTEAEKMVGQSIDFKG